MWNGGRKMAEEIKVLISEEEVEEKIKQLAQQISRDYEGRCLHIICILKGSVFFACRLAQQLTIPVTMDFLSVSSYGNGTKSSGRVKITKDLDASIEEKEVIIIEDIIDSGTTLSYLMELLQVRKPKSLTLCTLLSKETRRMVDIPVQYVGFSIPDKFVVGYGLDYAQKFRNLPYIGIIDQ